jgi:hypothetical protein
MPNMVIEDSGKVGFCLEMGISGGYFLEGKAKNVVRV